ncbi:MAG: TetR/AcrR family transcriptional regulator [Gammaproteobacteria bacterium]|nr:TetR/AcrR family transcriptional regulator [Gammaproteobacteria bacterium]
MSRTQPTSDNTCVRARIIAAAVEVLQEQGMSALTQARVSEMAGVRQSHLTYYFPTRNDLLMQAVVSGTAALLEELEKPAAGTDISLDTLRQRMEAQFADRRVPRMMAALVAASEEDPGLKPWLAQFRKDMFDHTMRALQARGLNPSRATLELFQAALVGAVHLDLAEDSAQSRRRTRAIIRRAFDYLVAVSQNPPDTVHRARRKRI